MPEKEENQNKSQTSKTPEAEKAASSNALQKQASGSSGANTGIPTVGKTANSPTGGIASSGSAGGRAGGAIGGNAGKAVGGAAGKAGGGPAGDVQDYAKGAKAAGKAAMEGATTPEDEEAMGRAAAKAAATAVAGTAGTKALETAEKVPIAGEQLKKIYSKAGKTISTSIKVISFLILLIFGMTAIIFFAIISSINNGSTGQTAPQKADLNNPTQRSALHIVQAYTGDQDMKREAVNDISEGLMTKISTVKGIQNAVPINLPSTVYAESESDVDETGIDIKEDGTSNIPSNEVNLDEQVIDETTQDLQSTILALNTADDQSPAGITALKTKVQVWKNSLSESEKTKYKNEIEEIDKDIGRLTVIASIGSTAKLVIPAADLAYIRNNEVDIRVVQALNYLVTPRNLGGAGYRKIKVRRIKSQYDSNKRKFDREWYEPEDAEEVVSAHFEGQAFDISGIDYAERRLYKKRVIKKMSKTEPRPPVDIMVVDQSTKLGKSDAFGTSNSSTGNTFGTLFENQALSELYSTIAENTGYDFSQYDIRGSNLNDAVKTIGIVALGEELGIKIDPIQDNSSSEKFFSNLGGNLVSSCLDIPESALNIDNPEEITSNIGRETIAQRMKIEALSLSGNTSAEILESVGKRKIEKNLGIRIGSLNYMSANDTIFAYIGQVIVEQTLNLAGGTFAGNNIDSIKEKIGGDSFNSIFANDPGQIDAILSLPIDDGDTQKLLDKEESPIQYKEKIGRVIIQAKVSNYKNHNTVGEIKKVSSDNIFGRCGGMFNRNANLISSENDCYLMQTSNTQQNQQDEAFDIPEGSAARLFPENGRSDFQTFHDIGVDEVAKRLTDIEEERQEIRMWLTEYKDKQLGELTFLRISDVLDNITDLEKKIKIIRDKGEKTTQEEKDNLSDYTSRLEKISWVRSAVSLSSPSSIDALQITLAKNIEEGIDGENASEIQANLDGFNRALNKYEIYKKQLFNDYTEEKKQSQLEMANFAANLILLGGKLTDGKWTFGNSDLFTVITEDPLNQLLGLPNNSVSKIFRTDSGSDVFYTVGENKIEDADYKQNNNYKSRALSRMQFLETQIDASNKKIEELKKIMGQDASSQIKMYENSIAVLQDQEAMEQANALRDNSTAEEMATKRKKSESLGIKCSDLNIKDILNDPSNQIIKIGASKLESSLELPSGSLANQATNSEEEYPIDYIPEPEVSPSATTKAQGSLFDSSGIGAAKIEEILEMPSGIFVGTELSELIYNLGGEETLYKYFAPDNSYEEIQTQLPISATSEEWFRSIFKNTDAKLGIDEGSTYDLFVEALTPNEYAAIVGKSHLEGEGRDIISKELNLNIGGYGIGYDDIQSLLKGDYIGVALKLGAKTMDEGMDLPEGTTDGLIDDPGADCTIQNDETGTIDSCISGILEASGKEKLAEYMHVYSQATISDNTSENLGQTKIEETLNEIHPNPDLPQGWLSGANLTQVVENIARLNNDNLMKNMAKYDAQTMKDSENAMLQKFGFDLEDTTQNTVKSLQKNGFALNSPAYIVAKTLDEQLKIPVGTTAQLFQGKMTLKKFKNIVYKKYSQNEVKTFIYGKLFDDETISTMEKLGISQDSVLEFATDLANGGTKTKDMLEANKDKITGILSQGNGSDAWGEMTIESRLDPGKKLKSGWFAGSTLQDVKLNIAALMNAPETLPAGLTWDTWRKTLVANTASWMTSAEKNLLAAFQITDGQFQNLKAIKDFDFTTSEGKQSSAYNAFLADDSYFSLKPETTLKLFKGEISITDYTHRVQTAYATHKATSAAVKQFLPENVQDVLNRHGLSPEDVVYGIKNPETLFTKVLMTSMSEKEMGILVGLGSVFEGTKFGAGIDQIKGEFTDNLAQKKIEQTLGLIPGTFSKDSSLEAIMEANGVAKFAAAFRINTNYSESEANLRTFLKNSVFRKDINSPYWSQTTNISRSTTVDNLLEILNVETPRGSTTPTKALLQKEISITDYIELVRKSAFTQVAKPGFLTGLAASLVSGGMGDQNDPKTQKIMSYANLLTNVYETLKDPKSLRKDKEKQATLFASLQSVSGFDLDDKAGFTTGTIENLIKYPNEAPSILLAQGLRGLSEKIFGEKDTGLNELLTLFQYYIPTDILNPGFYFGDAEIKTDAADSCPIGSKDLSEEEMVNFVKNNRSRCGQLILNTTLKGFIENTTAVKQDIINPDTGEVTEGDVIVPGIQLPDKDLENLKKGDMKIFTAMSITNMVNRANTQLDEEGHNSQIIPAGFQLNYEDVAAAMGLRSKLTASEESKMRDDFTQDYIEKNGIPLLPNDLKEYKNAENQYILDHSVNIKSIARKNMINGYMDAQLMATFKVRGVTPILPGFTAAMFSGNDKDRNNMLLACGINYAISTTGVLGPDITNNAYIMDALNSFTETRDINKLKESFASREGIQNTVFSFVDQGLSKKLGIELPPDTAKNLFSYLTTGKFSTPGFSKDTIQGQVYGLIDKQIGLPSGTTGSLISNYKQFAAGNMSPTQFLLVAVQLLFGKALMKADAELGVPPGTLSAAIGVGVAYLAMTQIAASVAAGSVSAGSFAATMGPIGLYIAAAMFVYTLVFGFSKIEMQMTCPGDPSFIAGGPTTQWCRAEEEMPQLLTSWAQINIRRLIEDMLRIDEPTRTNDPNLFPTIMGTFRKEDVDYFHGQETLSNGQKSPGLADEKYSRYEVFRGMRDLWQSDYMGDFVHIGY
ncbi:MAG TPA: hypothetical protein P5096_01125 [Patescibacteria group bacterium]|nr:hypothetical protein [Patescibacteria group bacterium]